MVLVGRRLAAFGLAACTAAASSSKSAHGREYPDTKATTSVLELRGAMVAREVSGGPRVHDTKFKEPNALTWGLEVAHHPLRIPSIGSLGIGFGVHYMHHEAVTRAGAPKESKTVFQMVPLSAGLVAQFDGLVSCCNVGILPYGKVTIVTVPWKLRRGENKTESGKEVYADTVLGSGTVYGVGRALGARFLLDSDRGRASKNFNASAFAEYAKTNLGGGGLTVNLTWWTVGVAAAW